MSTIKTGTTLTTAYQVEGDTTGALVIQTGASPTTAVTIGADQTVTTAGNVNLANAFFLNGRNAGNTGYVPIVKVNTSDVLEFGSGGYNAYFTGKTTNASTISVGNATPSASGAGITFPATQSASTDANTLDDYEEGTWTPNVGGNATYSAQAGNYVKVGRVVTVWFDFNINIIGTGGTSGINGLPFTAGGGTNGMGGSVVYWASLATPVTSLMFRVDVGGAVLQSTAGVSASVTASLNPVIFGNSSRVIGTVTYETSA